MVNAAKKAGANGFIVVDLPLEEAVSFRDYCSTAGFDPLSPSMYELISAV